MRYNDVSVLESHHAAVGWDVLRRSGLLAPLRPADARALRRTMLAAVLATDMSAHKTLLAAVEARLAAGGAGSGDAGARPAGGGTSPAAAAAAAAAAALPLGFSRDSDDDRQLLVSLLLHCADLCNPLFPPAMSRRIAADLGREFAAQAELERAAGMPVTVMLADTDAAKAQLEVGFIDFGAPD